MNKKILQGIVVCLGSGFALDLPTTNYTGAYVGSFVPFLVTALFVVLMRNNHLKERQVKDRVVINVLAILLTMFYLLSQIELILRYDRTLLCVISFAMSFGGAFLLLRLLIDRVVSFLQDDYVVINKGQNKYKPSYIFIGTFVILLLVWTFTFLILFPGIFGVDSLENLEQALGVQNMNVLFPFYMTLYLRLCWNIGIMVWGSGNAGVALYCVTQMVIMALVVSYMIYGIYKCNVKKSICIMFLLYFILIPYHAQCSIVVFKDTPYAIGTLLFMQLMWEYYVFGEPNKRYKKVIKFVAFVLSGILMSLSRANGFAAFLFCLPFAVIIFCKKQKRVMSYVLVTFVTILLVRGPLFDLIITKNNQVIDGTGAPVYDIRYEEPEPVEGEQSDNIAKAVPGIVSNASASYEATGVFIITAQQLGRVAVDRELTQEEYNKLSTVINVDEMKETYNPYITTAAMRQINNWNTREYLGVWLEFGIKYPYTYYIAWRDQTSGYWDPILYTDGIDLTFGDKNPEVYPDSMLPDSIVELYYKVMDMNPTKVPLIALFWCNGFMTWIAFFAIALTAIKRNISSMVFYAPLIGLWLTLLIANPCNGSFRYFYSFFLCIPLILIIPFVKGQHEQIESKILDKKEA